MGFEIDFLAVGDGERGGDAIALRYGNLAGSRAEQFVMVIDGGTEASAERLIDLVTRGYQTRQIDLALSTHPDQDHVNGLHAVLDELDVAQLAMHQPWHHSPHVLNHFADRRLSASRIRRELERDLDSAWELELAARRKRIPIVEPFHGIDIMPTFSRLLVPSGRITVLGPSLEYYRRLLAQFEATPEPADTSAWASILFGQLKPSRESLDFGGLGLTNQPSGLGLLALSGIPGLDPPISGHPRKTPGIGLAAALLGTNSPGRTRSFLDERLGSVDDSTAENDSSVILLVEIEGHRVLLTGDAGVEPLRAALAVLRSLQIDPRSLYLAQIPHHGSRRNVSSDILDAIFGPRWTGQSTRPMAICSSPAASAKHPSPKVINALVHRGASAYATRGTSLMFRSSNVPLRPGLVPIPSLGMQRDVDDDE